MSCCEPRGYKEEEINGKCKSCGEPTVNGEAYEVCGYSTVECKDCGFAPCDESC